MTGLREADLYGDVVPGRVVADLSPVRLVVPRLVRLGAVGVRAVVTVRERSDPQCNHSKGTLRHLVHIPMHVCDGSTGYGHSERTLRHSV